MKCLSLIIIVTIIKVCNAESLDSLNYFMGVNQGELFQKVFPPPIMDTIALKQHTKKYFDKFDELNIDYNYQYEYKKEEWGKAYITHWKTVYKTKAYHSKINILGYEKLKNIGVDLKKYLTNDRDDIILKYGRYKLPYQILESSIILTATVIDSNMHCKTLNQGSANDYIGGTIYKLKIDSFIKGGYLYDNKINYLEIGTCQGYYIDLKKPDKKIYKPNLNLSNDQFPPMTYSLGDKLLLFFHPSLNNYELFEADHNKLTPKIIDSSNFEQIHKIDDFFSDLEQKRKKGQYFESLYEVFKIRENKLYWGIHQKEWLYKDYDLTDIINLVEKIEEINRTKNFYKIDFSQPIEKNTFWYWFKNLF